MATVYELKFPNGKSYFGYTHRDDVTVRLYQHKQHARLGSKLPVHCAIRKYQNFEVVILDDQLTEADAKLLEVQVIRNFKERSYNLTKGGDGRTGIAHNVETHKKMSEAQKRRVQRNPEWRKRLQTLALGRRKYPKDSPSVP